MTFVKRCHILSNEKWNSSYLLSSLFFNFSLTLLHKFYGKTREFSLNLNVFWMLLFHCSFSQQNFFRKLFRRWSQITDEGQNTNLISLMSILFQGTKFSKQSRFRICSFDNLNFFHKSKQNLFTFFSSIRKLSR